MMIAISAISATFLPCTVKFKILLMWSLGRQLHFKQSSFCKDSWLICSLACPFLQLYPCSWTYLQFRPPHCLNRFKEDRSHLLSKKKFSIKTKNFSFFLVETSWKLNPKWISHEKSIVITVLLSLCKFNNNLVQETVARWFPHCRRNFIQIGLIPAAEATDVKMTHRCRQDDYKSLCLVINTDQHL